MTLAPAGEVPVGRDAGRETGGAGARRGGRRPRAASSGERKRGARCRRTKILVEGRECSAGGCPGRRTGSNLAVPDDYLDPRLTERRNPRSATIDTASALEIVDLIGAEDAASLPRVAAGARGDRAAPST